MGTVQQLIGILMNVFLFSVCVTRFQMPQSELFFSQRAIFMTRDGVPHLILRVGNRATPASDRHHLLALKSGCH